MSHTHHSHAHRKRLARIYLAIVAVFLAATSVLLWRFAVDPFSPRPVFIGLVFGYALAAALLLIGVVRRTGWARYVLIGLNWLMLSGFGLLALNIGSDRSYGFRRTCKLLGPPLVLLVAANTWLIHSKRIRHLVTPPPSGG